MTLAEKTTLGLVRLVLALLLCVGVFYWWRDVVHLAAPLPLALAIVGAVHVLVPLGGEG